MPWSGTLRRLYSWPPPPSRRETAWLDGLRGVAAFLVMVYHLGLVCFLWVTYDAPFGSQAKQEGGTLGEPMYQFWRLPILRLWMASGHTQVSIFFVLSGFVLSWGPLTALHGGNHAKFSSGLASATFRRWMRLYLPCFAISLIHWLRACFGVGDNQSDPESNPLLQLWDVMKANDRFSDALNLDRDGVNSLHKYDGTMWTIPIEFAGSMGVFVLLLSTSRITSHPKRLLVFSIAVLYTLFHAKWYYFLFFTGTLLAEHVIHAGGFSHLPITSRTTYLFLPLLLLSLFLGGVPEAHHPYTDPGYAWLRPLVPPNWRLHEGGGRWYWAWAGVLFVVSATHLPRIRRLFEGDVMRWLGRVSFMLYITHRIVLALVGMPFRNLVFWAAGRKDALEFFANGTIVGNGWWDGLVTLTAYVAFLVPEVLVSLLVANWAEILIDAPSTRFARRVEAWFLEELGEEKGARSELALLPATAGGAVVAR